MKSKVNGMEKIKNSNWRSVAAFLIFCIILGNVFLGITYVFRNTGHNREHITGIKEVKDIDLVYIGGSAAFVYWQPPTAWHQYGITSYNYATDSMQAGTIKREIQEVLKYQKPELFVIDARAFQYWTEDSLDEIEAAGVRNVTDSMDYGWNRFQAIHDAFRYIKHDEDADMASYYFDIAKYHSDLERLKDPSAWEMKKNEKESAYNGWEFVASHEALEMPKDISTDEREKIPEGSEKILKDLLKYCKKEELNVLFVVCPYFVKSDEQKQYNYIGDIIDSYGYDYLNTNYAYEELGLDYSRDFYNVNHVNPYGAEKYTHYLAQHIKMNYTLKDYRTEENEGWGEIYNAFVSADQSSKKTIDTIIQNKESSYQEGLGLKNITNINDWLSRIQDDNYYIMAASQGKSWTSTKTADRILMQFGIGVGNSMNKIRVYIGAKSTYSNDSDGNKTYFKGMFSGHSDYNQQYEINCGQAAEIKVNGTEYSRKHDGLNIVVYDKNYRQVLDSVSFIQNEDGTVIMQR